MPRTVRVDTPGAVHHVIARGNEQKSIFRDDTDRRIFLSRLARCQPRFGFTVLAYCLMGNHVHLAVRTGREPLARVLLTVLSAYASDFNRRYRRVGHLFQGRYKAFRIRDDRHLLAVVRYIHRNPVAAGIVPRADVYPWSSDRLYRRRAVPQTPWFDTLTVKRILSTSSRDFARLYDELIDGESHDSVEDDEPPRASGESACEMVIAGSRPRPTIAGLPLSAFAATVSELTGQSSALLVSSARRHDVTRARALTALLARNLAGIPLCRSADYFGRDESVVTRSVSVLERRLREDAALRRLVQSLESRLLQTARMHD